MQSLNPDQSQSCGCLRAMNKTEKIIVIVSLAVSILLAFFYMEHQIVSGDQYQMLDKGYHALVTGEYLPYGNEASTMGNLPGSLSSIVVGFPLTLVNHPMAPGVLVIILRTLGVLIFANAIAQIFSTRTVVIGIAIYALNPWYLYDFLLYNPSYLSFGAAIFLNMLIRMRRGQELSFKQRFLCSAVMVLSVGFCLQFHFSWPVLVALSGILWLRRDLKVSYLGVAAGVALTLLWLVPYFVELSQNSAIASSHEAYAQERYFGYGAVHVYPLFKALLYWLRFGSLLVTNKAIVPNFEEAVPFIYELLRYVWIGITQAVGIVTVVICAYFNYRLIFRQKHEPDDNIRYARSLTISCIIGLLVAAGASTVLLNYWQIIILFCFALVPVLAFFENFRRFTYKHLAILMIVMTAMSLVGALSSIKFDYKTSYSVAAYQHCLNSYTASQCGLSEEEAQVVLNTPVVGKRER